MTDPTISSPPEPRRPLRLVTRWIAASLVIVIAFVGARATAGPDTAASDSTPSMPGSAPADHPEPTPPSTSSDPVDSYEDLLDDVLGEDVSEESDGATPRDAEWATASGRGAGGGTWTMQYPKEWTLDEVNDGLVTFSASGRPDVAMVATRPFVGPFEAETDRDLEELLSQLADGEVIYYEPTTIQDRDATQANLRYTNPDGEPAAVSITWIHDAATIYLIAGEAPVDHHELQSRIEATLNSFTLSDAV